MRKRDISLAARFKIRERLQELEEDLLAVDGIVYDMRADGVDIGIDGFLDEIYQVVIVPKYKFPIESGYFSRVSNMKADILETLRRNDLRRTGDRIEDYGEHLYIVTECGKSWRRS